MVSKSSFCQVFPRKEVAHGASDQCRQARRPEISRQGRATGAADDDRRARCAG